MAVQQTLSIKDCLHLMWMQRTVHINASSTTFKGLVTTDDNTLEMHVSTKDGMLDGHTSTQQQDAEGRMHQLGPCTLP